MLVLTTNTVTTILNFQGVFTTPKQSMLVANFWIVIDTLVDQVLSPLVGSEPVYALLIPDTI